VTPWRDNVLSLETNGSLGELQKLLARLSYGHAAWYDTAAVVNELNHVHGETRVETDVPLFVDIEAQEDPDETILGLLSLCAARGVSHECFNGKIVEQHVTLTESPLVLSLSLLSPTLYIHPSKLDIPLTQKLN
jgi:hypothetical protein